MQGTKLYMFDKHPSVLYFAKIFNKNSTYENTINRNID
jgi:hypothetical protein